MCALSPQVIGCGELQPLALQPVQMEIQPVQTQAGPVV